MIEGIRDIKHSTMSYFGKKTDIISNGNNQIKWIKITYLDIIEWLYILEKF